MTGGGEKPPWERVDAVFTRVLELAPEDRSAFLEKVCERDAALRGAVEKLLSTDAEAEGSGFLDRPAAFFWRSLWEEAVRESFDQQSLSGPGPTC